MPTDRWQVEHNDDDCLYRYVAVWFSKSATYIRIGYVSDADRSCGGGFRFSGVGLDYGSSLPPKGSTIISAKLTLCARYSKTDVVVNCRLKGENMAEPVSFSDGANFLGRAKTTAVVDWDNVTAFIADNWHDSVDITSIIQELVTAYDVTAIVIFWDDYDERGDQEDLHCRECYSHDQDDAKAAILEITWDDSSDCGTLVDSYGEVCP